MEVFWKIRAAIANRVSIHQVILCVNTVGGLDPFGIIRQTAENFEGELSCFVLVQNEHLVREMIQNKAGGAFIFEQIFSADSINKTFAEFILAATQENIAGRMSGLPLQIDMGVGIRLGWDKPAL